VADYNNVYKDKCKTEFMKLKDCYLVSFPPSLEKPSLIVRLRRRTKNDDRYIFQQ